MRFSTSLNKPLVCGCSLVRHEATSWTALHGESLVMSPSIPELELQVACVQLLGKMKGL